MKGFELKTMREKVKEELDHIPSSPKPQRDLRMVYWPLRMNSLGKKAERRKDRGEVLSECIKHLREHGGCYLDKGSDYKFVYDKKFFGPLAMEKSRGV